MSWKVGNGKDISHKMEACGKDCDPPEDVEFREKNKGKTAHVNLFNGVSDIWQKRLTDYQFLCGNDEPEPPPKRYSLLNTTKSNSRARITRVLRRLTLQGDVYWRQQVQDYPWWADRMSREEAARSLGLCDEGTFLLRWSERHDQPVLSLRAMGKVKHMRVYQQEEGNFYLSEVRCFGSIVELINYYRQFPLSESFTGLECILRKPLYDMALVRFPYEGSGPSHLALVKDQLVVIISREGQERGWWKGRIGTRVGYFPKEYVTISDDPMGDW